MICWFSADFNNYDFQSKAAQMHYHYWSFVLNPTNAVGIMAIRRKNGTKAGERICSFQWETVPLCGSLSLIQVHMVHAFLCPGGSEPAWGSIQIREEERWHKTWSSKPEVFFLTRTHCLTHPQADTIAFLCTLGCDCFGHGGRVVH